MYTLTTSDAIALVRKNLDELEPNGSVMYLDEGNDNKSLDDIIKRNLPEAINAVCLAAPVHLLEGEEPSSIGVTPDEDDSRILHIVVGGAQGAILRLVAFRCGSNHTVTQFTEEASVEGRKQLNPYLRGTYDRPVLVRRQDARSSFTFYALENPPEQGTTPLPDDFSVVFEKQFAAATTSYPVPAQLRQNIIDYLTALTMETYSDQRAQGFFTRANQFAA